VVASVKNHFPQLLDKPATSVTKAEVKACVESVRANSGPAAARLAHASLRAAFRWAVRDDKLSSDPLADLKPPEGKFERLNEVARLTWDEITTGDDGKQSIMLEGARTKTSQPHWIPLSSVACEVLSECPRLAHCRFVFSSDGWRAINDFARLKVKLDAAIAEDGPPIADWHFHDLRHATVSLLAGEDFEGGEGFDPVVLDRLLGHAPTKLTAIGRRYQRQEFAKTRRRALEEWAAFVMRPPRTAEIVELPARKSAAQSRHRRR
jgi:integrase